MAGNSIGQLFVLTTSGESHGPGLLGIIDGCPPGLVLSADDFVTDMQRRKTGQSRFTSQRQEEDHVEILSGVFDGRTTGAPIGLRIANTDQRSRDYADLQGVYRPGHADFTYQAKYGHRDYRGGGRASARETAMRVAAGVIAKKYLAQQLGLQIRGYCAAIGEVEANTFDWSVVEQNPFYFPDNRQVEKLAEYLTEIRRAGDSVGAAVCVQAERVPVGLGEPIFSRLDADIAHAMMSIPAAKGVEIGDGFAVITQRGSEHRDEMTPQGFCSNHAGGILGGISSGQTIHVRVAFKPTASIVTPGNSVNTQNEAVTVVTKGRHDPCVGIRAVPIVEAMLALVLMDHYLRHKAQNL